MFALHIVIPVYNESATIATVLDHVHRAPLPSGWSRRVTVVDDGSSDGTVERLESLRSTHRTLAILRHQQNRGKGAAVRTGFDHVLAVTPAREHTTTVAIIQDADLEYSPSDYPNLLAPFEQTAMCVYGSRFGAHRSAERLKEKIHAWGNRNLTDLSNRLTGYTLRDMECGYKCLRVDLLARIRPELTEDRFGIEPQMTAALARARVPIEEVAITYRPRGFGQGKKIKWPDAVWAIWVMMREAIRPSFDASVSESIVGSTLGVVVDAEPGRDEELAEHDMQSALAASASRSTRAGGSTHEP